MKVAQIFYFDLLDCLRKIGKVDGNKPPKTKLY